jgi:hypothetical protein
MIYSPRAMEESSGPPALWIAAAITVVLATAFLVVHHAVSSGVAILIAVVVLVGISLAVLRSHARPTQHSPSHVVGRLIVILVAAGVLAALRILGEGWQREDAIGVAVYLFLLCGLFVIYKRSRKRSEP